jgi:hypothetical protein
MIRVVVTEAELLRRIDALDAGKPPERRWLARAAALTEQCVAAGKVGEGDGIWSEVKSVYIELQRFKCIYCEQAMPESVAGDAHSPGGRVVLLEHDVEHFRPKNRVTPWPPSELAKRRGITYESDLRHGVAAGYVGLAFDPLNYAISCKVCNTSYKKDHFPILGTAAADAPSRAERDALEQPLLVLPFGEDPEDPEALISFVGVFPRPRPASGPGALRALVLIDFFELDTRADLINARSTAVVLLWPRLEARAAGSAEAAAFVDAMVNERSLFPQVACARAFVSLYEADHASAARWYELCLAYMVSRDASVLGGT